MMIAKKTIKFITILAMMFSSFITHANNSQTPDNSGGRIDTPEKVKEYIMHHLADSHDFTLFSYTNDAGERKHFGVSLPIIVWTSEGLKVFSSSDFKHNDDGKVIVDKGEVKLTKYHSKIYELNSGETSLSFDKENHPTNAKRLLDFSITKSVIGMLLASLLIFFGFKSLANSYKKGPIPTGIGRFLEPLVLFIRDDLAIPNVGKKHYRKTLGYLLTIFFFVFTLNLLGLTPLGFNVTGQIAVTVCLALFTFFIVQFNGNKNYWAHIFWFPGVPVPMKIMLAPIEVLGMLIKPFSLFMRLFANITAGHVVLMSLIGLVIVLKEMLGPVGSTGMSLLLGIFIMLIEILVAFLQAYIFTMLSSLFIGAAVDEGEDH